jgi:hypothetical protein
MKMENFIKYFIEYKLCQININNESEPLIHKIGYK